jgi:PAB-dependent poly(A)-specific ribonuclease subunit 2
VVFYERVDTQVIDIASIPWEKDLPVLTEDLNVSLHRDPESVRHRVLTTDEIPSPGDLVAIDAEFVALNPEELELSSSGTRSLIRPTTMSLARVSVLRGQGPKECEPFIDDHIVTRERIFDYLTQFSGIVDGDLDPAKSRHTVIPQKLAYKKLRLLVDLGCVFIGHGLKKDFRIINIHVPPKQVIDTVDLYSSALQARKLSLRFLSWFLLKEDIQGTGAEKAGEAGGTGVIHGHDSIEDARAALHLYRIYETFQRDGRLEDVMEDLYEAGKRFNWRPPVAAAAGAGDGQASKMGTPTLTPTVLSGSL